MSTPRSVLVPQKVTDAQSVWVPCTQTLQSKTHSACSHVVQNLSIMSDASAIFCTFFAPPTTWMWDGSRDSVTSMQLVGSQIRTPNICCVLHSSVSMDFLSPVAGRKPTSDVSESGARSACQHHVSSWSRLHSERQHSSMGQVVRLTGLPKNHGTNSTILPSRFSRCTWIRDVVVLRLRQCSATLRVVSKQWNGVVSSLAYSQVRLATPKVVREMFPYIANEQGSRLPSVPVSSLWRRFPLVP